MNYNQKRVYDTLTHQWQEESGIANFAQTYLKIGYGECKKTLDELRELGYASSRGGYWKRSDKCQ
jgi:hypothetical protein